ncbi:dihydroorotate dehydrogenase electron transfer subunit [Candidatus Termititenax dinenymphae]|uniref:Dihydroorotate dehydrogenase electron transfer subunit n=1 Tax=Candidatus Termititenax dinenymphae TaxID=2218523 RepID=A0A388TJG9_9BACT|nr:dihydroorotate dehydrogenase electron transfer subunit [Candidatus Termititenax dinenymphae]
MKTLYQAVVTKTSWITSSYLLLTLNVGVTVSVQAGQFAALQIPGVYLRRPFSIHDADGTTLSFLIKIVGKGTQKLAELKTGDKISVIYPLGNGFILSDKPAVLAGGGCGIAPLLLLAKQLKNKPTVILGGRTKADIVQLDAFAEYAEVKVTTEDGTLGTKGFVTAELTSLSQDTAVYACGPEPMLRALHKLAKEKKFELQLSLEAMMGCGIGACLGCVTDTKKDGHVCVCTEGPVFKAEELVW